MTAIVSTQTPALNALNDYQVMGTAPERDFDDLVRLASMICQTPIALISLLDEDRQWFKAKVGLGIESTPREHAFCRYTIQQDEVLVVPDATADERFAENPFVKGDPNIRFYAGAPLITPDDVRIGSICVLDQKVRTLDDAQREALAVLGRQVVAQFESRRAVRQLTEAIEQRDNAITGSEIIHREMAKRNTHHELILATLSEGIVTQSLENGIETFNDSACQILGLTPDQLSGRHSMDPRWRAVREDSGPFPGEEHPAMITLRTGQPCSGVIMGIHQPNSDMRWVSINTRLLPKANPHENRTAIVSFHDITEHRRSEAALAEAKRLAESIAEQTTCIIYILDLQSKVLTYANRSVGEFLGYGLAKIVEMGDNFLPTITHPDDLAMVREKLAAFANVPDGKVVEYNTRWKHADAQWRSLWHRQIVFRRHSDGRPSHIMGTTQDITDLLHTQQELQMARDAANLANETKSRFLANMSHEIRTPMTAILGFADRLLEPTLSAEDRGDCVETIRRNGTHLMKVIDDVLDLSKIDAGKMTVERLCVRPALKVRDVFLLMQPVASKHGLRLISQFQPDVPEVILSDPTRIRQILINLVGNAIKFTPTGEVRVEVSMAPPAADGNRQIRFSVVDTGVGMTTEQLGRLFHPFSQADASTTRRFGGTGLGLAICRGLAERLGGTLHVQSTPGKGSRFTATVDAGDPREITEAIQASKTHPGATAQGVPPVTAPGIEPLTGRRILLAEDGPDNQRLISHFLRAAGADVVIADTGKTACELARASLENNARFDLILMDMAMPVMDGNTAARALRSSGWEGPIVALTAHALEEERASCLAAGCSGFLSKPVTRAALVSCAHDAITRSESEEQPIHSTLEDEPLMNELIALYLAELPALRNELDRMASANDVDGARLLAHRLRGSGGSYGFPQISAAAAELDALARTASSGADWINACRELTAILRRVALRRTASVV